MPARILVVDDDPLSGELISEILSSAGMDTSFLTSSVEAAGRLKREKYHAVFMDMRMPPPDGVELARQIRASGVNASTIIVMITGEEERTLMKRAFDFTRVPLQRPVSLHANDKQLEGTTVDISFDGMLVQSYLVFPSGTRVQVTLDLQNGSTPLQLEARVLRTLGTDRMAVQFKSQNATERNRLQEFLLPLILSGA